MKLFILHCPVYHQMNVVVPVLSLFFTWMDQVPFIDVYQAGFSLYYSKTIRKKTQKDDPFIELFILIVCLLF